MHAHDRTLLASLGFADKDKQNPRHALACRYLCREDVAEKLMGSLVTKEHVRGSYTADVLSEEEASKRARANGYEPLMHSFRVYRRETEVAIHKGQGQYRTTIGFWDVVLDVSSGVTRAEQVSKEDYKNGVLEKTVVERVYHYDVGVLAALIEVKASPVEADEIVRQLELYRGYPTETRSDTQIVVAAITWDLTPDEKAIFDAKKVHVVRLGQAFDAYCASEAKAERVSAKVVL